jgi:hypothetical protein
VCLPTRVACIASIASTVTKIVCYTAGLRVCSSHSLHMSVTCAPESDCDALGWCGMCALFIGAFVTDRRGTPCLSQWVSWVRIIYASYFCVVCRSWMYGPRCQSQWPHCLWRGSATFRLLGLRVRIPPGVWMCVSCESCVLSGRGLCVGLITRPEGSYRLWCVWLWSLNSEEALIR